MVFPSSWDACWYACCVVGVILKIYHTHRYFRISGIISRLGLSERYSCNPYNPLTDGPRSSGGYYLLQSTLQYLVTSIPRLRCSVVVLWAAPRTVLYLCSATLLFVCPLLPGVVAWRGASHESHLTTAASLVSFAQEAVNFGSRSALVYSLLLLMLPLRSPLTSAPDRPAS